MSARPVFIMRNQRPKYNIRTNVKFKNKLNSDIVIGDLINEEEIDGKNYFVIRNAKGSVVKLTKEAYAILK